MVNGNWQLAIGDGVGYPNHQSPTKRYKRLRNIVSADGRECDRLKLI
ncbi:MAG: hypothetical protein HC847_06185 [Hydrococcus sp. RU_2_2]|nr:hypothetical protein [Hydrococcus sp. RU_2_2]